MTELVAVAIAVTRKLVAVAAVVTVPRGKITITINKGQEGMQLIISGHYCWFLLIAAILMFQSSPPHNNVTRSHAIHIILQSMSILMFPTSLAPPNNVSQ